MKRNLVMLALLSLVASTGCRSSQPEMMGNLHEKLSPESFYLPDAEASRVVSVATNGVIAANVLVQTHRVAVKETGPREVVEQFGEVYAFSPSFFAARRDEPTMVRFWNLQPDDNHGFMLIDPHSRVLLSVLLPPLKETSYVFTFHEEGLFSFVCPLHPRSMAGQLLVLPPRAP